MLENNSVKATSFLIGEKVRQHPDITEKTTRHGHTLGIHTFTHRDLIGLTAIEIADELLRTQKAIKDATGCNTTIMRPPIGRFNMKTIKIVRESGLSTIMWTKSAKDYKLKERKMSLKG